MTPPRSLATGAPQFRPAGRPGQVPWSVVRKGLRKSVVSSRGGAPRELLPAGVPVGSPRVALVTSWYPCPTNQIMASHSNHFPVRVFYLSALWPGGGGPG